MRPLRFLALLLCVLCHTSIALAEDPRRGSPEYRELIRQALEEYGLGNFPEAKLFFSDAHALFPNARTLRGLALTEYALRDYVAAANYFEQALANQVQPLSPDLRTGATELLAQARRFIAHVTLSIEPSTAEVRIDERPLVRGEDGSLLLNPGPHELVARAPGRDTVTRRWAVEAGERTRLDITLPSRDVAVTGPAVPQPLAAGTPAPLQPMMAPPLEGSSEDSSSAAPFILIGVSGAVAIAGGVLLGVTAADIGTVEDARKGTEWADVKPAYERTPGVSIAGFSMLGLGLAGVAAGLAWQFWPEEKAETLSLRVSPNGAAIRGEF
jgi:hypothetical protein